MSPRPNWGTLSGQLTPSFPALTLKLFALFAFVFVLLYKGCHQTPPFLGWSARREAGGVKSSFRVHPRSTVSILVGFLQVSHQLLLFSSSGPRSPPGGALSQAVDSGSANCRKVNLGDTSDLVEGIPLLWKFHTQVLPPPPFSSSSPSTIHQTRLIVLLEY